VSATGPDGAAVVLETDRLTLRRLTEDDAEFMLGLLNEPSFHQYIGDRGVRTVEEARAYVRNGAMASYEAFGFGLWLVLRKEDGAPIGLCGLLKRETLPDVDIGFAFRPAFWSRGYAIESGTAVVEHERTAFGLTRLVAIVQADNAGSIRVLEKLGFRFERPIDWPGDTVTIHLYGRDLA
jgi:RimJ/RimL family protein N-acetyltransferase